MLIDFLLYSVFSLVLFVPLMRFFASFKEVPSKKQYNKRAKKRFITIHGIINTSESAEETEEEEEKEEEMTTGRGLVELEVAMESFLRNNSLLKPAKRKKEPHTQPQPRYE